jgi:hypothetical protein
MAIPMKNWLRRASWLPSGIAFLTVSLVASSAVLTAQVCAPSETTAQGSSTGVAGPADPGPGGPTPAEVPPTPNQAAIDDFAETYAETGTFDSGPTPVFHSSDLGGSTVLQDGDARAVLDFVYRHRLTDASDSIDALMARDAEVAQAYSGLVSTGDLVTSADTDPAAALHHLSLLRNAGSTGGFSVAGTQVISTGIRPLPLPPSCSVNPGGFIYWGNNTVFNYCMPNNREEAIVFLTVRQPNGTVYRDVTHSYACGPNNINRSSFGFRSAPSGSAEVIAHPLRRCCQEGRTTFQINCPPGPSILLACVPAQTNQLVSVTMGPWIPPGYWGTTKPGARVWIANKGNSCINTGETTADAQGNYTVRGCLPSEDVHVYAESGNLMGRVDVPDTMACGTILGPYNFQPVSRPKITGKILNWDSSWFPDAGALARGCSVEGCNGGAMWTFTAPGNQITGNYQLELKPGHWSLSSYRDFGYCTAPNGTSVRRRCERYYGEVDLAPGQQLTIDLPPVLTICPCPPF